jgi:predicted membrane-bound spermidine synthase
MGATVPVFGLIARSRGVTLSRLYAVNTAGAAFGTLGLALFVIGALGIGLTVQFVATINLGLAAAAFLMGNRDGVAPPAPDEPTGVVSARDETGRTALALVALTGAATFALEVAWFRALRAAFRATTDSFALVLAAVLIALAIGARLAPVLRRRAISTATLLTVAGVLILLATPAVERFDQVSQAGTHWFAQAAYRFGLTFAAVGPAMVALGSVLPRLLDAARTPRDWARLYATNTVAAVFGSLVAAWWCLPNLGFAATAWTVGALVGLIGAVRMSGGRRTIALGSVAAATAVAIVGTSGVGTTRALDPMAAEGQELIAWDEGPDSTVAVVDDPRFGRLLVIDGFYATGETASAHYMLWMGHLPAIIHPNPQSALVICFGTGQTANAVLREGVASLDIVDISAAVFGMAQHFEANEGVLDDPAVRPIVMDGRAWMARTDRRYDVVTLEPMPPNHAGVNSLYSVEFYERVYESLNDGGTVAQWLPLHLVSPRHSAGIAAAFVEVFPNAMLWIDPIDRTGILVGRKNNLPVADAWPGLERGISRSISSELVRQSVVLSGEALRQYAALSEPVTDDNQLLAWFTPEERQQRWDLRSHELNLTIIAGVADEVASAGQ